MGQYYDFGGQIGGILTEAFNRISREKMFNAEQAMAFMKMDAELKMHKDNFDLNQRQVQAQEKNLMFDNANNVYDDYIDENTIKMAGLDPSKFTPYSKEEIQNSVKKIYGESIPELPGKGSFYRKDAFNALREKIAQDRLAKSIEDSKPKVIGGMGNIPLKKTFTIPGTENNKFITTAEIPLEEHHFPYKAKRYGEGEGYKEWVMRIMPKDNASIINILNENFKTSFNPATSMAKIEFVNGRPVAKVSTSQIDESGFPSQVNTVEKYDPTEVASFFNNQFSQIEKDFYNMSQLDKQRDAGVLGSIGLQLADIVTEYPQYADRITPFIPYVRQLKSLLAEQQSRMDNRQSNTDLRGVNTALRVARMAGQSTNSKTQQRGNELENTLLDQYMNGEFK
jgi:hypothetical protein